MDVKLTPARLKTSTDITASISSAPSAKITIADFETIFLVRNLLLLTTGKGVKETTLKADLNSQQTDLETNMAGA